MAQATKGRLNYRCPSCFIRDLDIDMFYDTEKKEYYCLRCQFTGSEEYYSTLFHEAVHSTGHASRLARFDDHGASAFGSASYSREELVAEIGAASILHYLGIETPETFSNSASYIDGWSKSLRKDPKLFISATSRAEKAVRMILGSSANAPEAFDASEQ